MSAARTITVDGVTLTIPEWAERLGVPHQTIRHRLRKGWSERDAVTVQSGESEERYGRRVKAGGESLTVSEWAERLGISYTAMMMRLRSMPAEEAVTKPPDPSSSPRTITDGETFTITEWARRLGCHRDTIASRLARGWDPVRAVTEPARGRS